MKRGRILSFGMSAIFCASLFAFGCSSDETSTPTKADAGKKDTGGGTGGTGGSGGSGGTGGSAGSGGSSAKGGSGGSSAGGSGGSAGSGGSSAKGGSGGSAGAGGSGPGGSGGSTVGGAGGGGATGGSTSLDGSAGGTGGTTNLDGGSLDATGSDAIDAPLPGPDAPDITVEVGSNDDGAAPPRMDSGALDTASLDVNAIDTTVVLLDAQAADVESLDVEKLDLGADLADASHDIAAGNCLQQIIAGGYTATADKKCSLCQNSQPTHDSLETQCRTMVDCLNTASCPSETSPNNCWVNCRNQVSSNQIDTETCVLAMVTAVCQ